MNGENGQSAELRGLPAREPGQFRPPPPVTWHPPACPGLLARVRAALAAWDGTGPGPPACLVPHPRAPS